MSVPAAYGRRRWLTVLGVAVLLLGLASLGGCMRAQIAIAVDTDDLVSGEVVVGTVPADEEDPGAVLEPPPELAGKVRAEPFRDEDYAGTRLLFEGLTFNEFGQLSELQVGESERLRLQLRRAGQLVLFTALIDLTGIAAERQPDIQIRVSFPGQIAAHNGEQDDQTVSWVVPPNAITELNATARYTEPGTRSWQEWAMLVGGLTAGVVLIIILLALLSHRQYVRQAEAR